MDSFVDVRLTPAIAHTLVGVAFNIQNDSNYYVFRVAISDEDQCGYYLILTRRKTSGILGGAIVFEI